MSFFLLNKSTKKPIVKTASSKKLVQIELPSKDFIFAQNTIISSVVLEPNSFFIKPETNDFVNDNGDSFSNESTVANYSSFIGAYNYLNHVQDPNQSLGFVGDAVLRKIILDKDQNLFNYYVDILVATHKDHKKIVDLILSNQISFLSMGCDAHITTCSKCGNVYTDEETPYCECLTYNKGKTFIDKKGFQRRISEVLGTSEPGSVFFEEASYLTEPPAFHGAIKRNLLRLGEDSTVVLQVPEESLNRDAIKKYVGVK